MVLPRVQRLFSYKISLHDFFGLSLNIASLATFYTFFGAFISFIFYYLFDEYAPTDNPPRGMEWEKKGALYQIYDCVVEIILIALVSFWITFAINTSAPIFPVRADLSSFVDTYTTGMFFMYTIFLFMNDLSSKLMYLFNNVIGGHFDRLFPNAGSILDLSLRYNAPSSKRTSDST
jgi:hypothetical protein